MENVRLLYDNLKLNASTKKLTPADRKMFTTSINLISDKIGVEMLYMLILHHKYTIDQTIDGIPFEGVQTKTGVEFDTVNFQSGLIRILTRFMRLHAKRLEDDNNRITI